MCGGRGASGKCPCWRLTLTASLASVVVIGVGGGSGGSGGGGGGVVVVVVVGGGGGAAASRLCLLLYLFLGVFWLIQYQRVCCYRFSYFGGLLVISTSGMPPPQPLLPLSSPRFHSQIWNLRDTRSRMTKRGHRRPVTCLTFFDRDTCLAAGDEGGRVLLHRVADAAADEVIQ